MMKQKFFGLVLFAVSGAAFAESYSCSVVGASGEKIELQLPAKFNETVSVSKNLDEQTTQVSISAARLRDSVYRVVVRLSDLRRKTTDRLTGKELPVSSTVAMSMSSDSSQELALSLMNSSPEINCSFK